MRRIVPHSVGTIAQHFALLLKIYGLQKGAQTVNWGYHLFRVAMAVLRDKVVLLPGASGVEEGIDDRKVGHFRLIGYVE